MDHACAQQLDPALTVAGGADLAVHLAGAVALVALHIHLAGGLGEGEVVGTETDSGIVAVDLVHDGDEGTLQIAHGDVLIHHQTLDLVEHGGVGGVGLVLTEHTAGGQHAQRGLVVFHVAFAMGASQSTANIFSSWCKMLGGQVFLLLMNAWCLKLFTSMVGTFLANPLMV